MKVIDRIVLWVILLFSIMTFSLAIAIFTKKDKEAPTPPRMEREARPSIPEVPQKITASIDDDPVKGKEDASVIIVEFSDFECPFCRRFALTTLQQIKSEYIDTGKVKLVFRDYPLPFHRNAMDAARAANCAGKQGKYWEMHDKIFETGALSPDDLKNHAKALGLDMKRFESCMADPETTTEIQRDMADASEYGIRGTPSFIIGKNKGGKTFEGEPVRGALPFESFKAVIEKYLKD